MQERNADLIAACGNNCASCPRYNAAPFEKTQLQLQHTAELWMKIGYRDRLVSNEEISCTGCKPGNLCRYHVIECCQKKGIRTCAECADYPCKSMEQCFEVTASFEPRCRTVCTDEEYRQLGEAFFRKRENLARRWQLEGLLKLQSDFYLQDALCAAKAICGKVLCVRQKDGSVMRRRITETECYMGEEDSACHAHHGRTARTEVMYRKGGVAYVYLCYGMHNLLNIVTGPENHPQAVLIRGVEGASGPGRLTRLLGIDRSFNGVSFLDSNRIRLEADAVEPVLEASPRIGISYASDEDQARLWRFSLKY